MRSASEIRTSQVLIVLALLAIVPCMAGGTPPRGIGSQWLVIGDDDPPRVIPPSPACTVNEAVLHDQLRLTFENELLWTRMVAMGVLHDIEGHDVYLKRLSENYEAFEEALVPIYGPSAEKIGALLTEHVGLTSQVVHEIFAGMDFASTLPNWYKNGEQIAASLSALNPRFWPADEMSMHWKIYLDDILNGSLAFYRNDWTTDVIMLDTLHRDCLGMADYMTAGIVQQCAGTK